MGPESQALIICDLGLELSGADKTLEQTLSLRLHTGSDCNVLVGVVGLGFLEGSWVESWPGG